MTAFMCVIGTPVTAKITTLESTKPLLGEESAQTSDLLQQGKALYEAGRFAESVQILQGTLCISWQLALI